MPDYLPHTDVEIEAMLRFLGLGSLDELFSAVPEAIRLAGGLDIGEGMPEPDVVSRMEALGERNRARNDRMVCFAGGGAYDHEVPPVVRALAGRSEWVTSYTPYQAEVAQGVLQAMFEFQTMVSRLSGLAVANASLYDGANALVEAVNLGAAASGRPKVWLSAGVHPHWRSVLETFVAGTGHEIETVPLRDGRTRWPEPAAGEHAPPGVVVVAYPNFLGCLEDLEAVRRLCDLHGAVMVVAADPVLAGILRSPGRGGQTWRWGRASPWACRSASGDPTSDCSPAGPSTSDGFPVGWWARRLTPRVGGRTSRPCVPASRTSDGKRPPPTSAPTRR